MSSRERRFKRLMPLVAICVVLLAVLVVLLGGGDHDSAVRTQRAGDRAAKDSSTHSSYRSGATTAVTPQSTTRVGGAHDDPAPILMYHVTKAAPAGTPYPELWVSPADFRRQMQWLADNGYTGITLGQLFKYWDDGFKLPDKPVVISFDDGYPSQEKVARPTLARHRWPGVLFLELKNVGNPETGLTAAMVKKLIASGWEIGSHTISHPDLTTVSASVLRREVAGSKRLIARKFGVPVEFFCYPAGRYDDSVVRAVEAAGYKGATTTVEGVATPDRPFELKRVRIDGGDGVSGFAAKMRSAAQ